MKYLVQVRDDVEAGDEKLKELESEMKDWGIFDTDFCLGDILEDEDETNNPPPKKKNRGVASSRRGGNYCRIYRAVQESLLESQSPVEEHTGALGEGQSRSQSI